MTRYSAIALALLAAGAAQAAERTLDRTFAVSPGGTLVVDADAASVRVSGGDTNQVVVHMRFRGSEKELAATQLDAVQKGDGVTVTMRRQQKGNWLSWGSWNSDGNIEVTVPKRYGINVRTGGGNVELRDTAGEATLRTSGGNVEANDVNGNLELRTSGGSIRAETIRGDVDANTSGGDVRLVKIDGKITGHTSGGNVHCSLVGANRGISATTSGGNVEVVLPPGTSGEVDASTSGGSVSSDLSLTNSVIKEDRLRGSLNGGGAPIDARTSGGSVSLRAAN